MVGRFLILSLLILSGTALADTSSITSGTSLGAKIPIEPIIDSFTTAFQTDECGMDCELLLQIDSNSNKETESSTSEFNSLYSDLIEHFDTVYKPSTIYLTMKEMKEEIKFQQDTLSKMQNTGVDPNSGFYSKVIDQLSSSIVDYQTSLDKMETEDLVLVIEKGAESYISTDDYKYRIKKQAKESAVQNLLKASMTSSDLFNLHDSLTALYSVLRADDTCLINQVEYTYTDLSSYIDSVLDLAQETEHEEQLQAAADSITLQYSTAGQYWVKSEVKEFMEAWDSLIKILRPEESINIMSAAFDSPSSKEKYAELKGIYQRIHLGEVATFTERGELEVVPTPLVKASESMTGVDYIDLVKAAASWKKDLPVFKSDEVVTQLTSKGNVMVQFTSKSEPDTFLQVGKQMVDEGLNRDPDSYPKDPAERGNEYHEGDLSYIFVTSFLSDANSTGKFFAFDYKNPENLVEFEGFDRPTGTCYDVNNDFLYVVENGGDSKGIYMFQMKREYNSIEFKDGSYVIVFSGTAFDCKVDAYGNLYYTEQADGSIRKMTYSDLYFGFTNTDTVVYSDVEGLDKPGSMELRDSETLYFINTGNTYNNGTVNKASVESSESEINVIIQESSRGQGLAVTEDKIYYSLKNGAIKSYSFTTGDIQTYSRELEKPIGLCTSNHKVFAMDYAGGAIYEGEDLLSENMEVFAYVQAPYSCFCLNYKDSSSLATKLILSLVTLFLI